MRREVIREERFGGSFPIVWDGKLSNTKNKEKIFSAAIQKVSESNKLEAGAMTCWIMRVGCDVMLSFGLSKCLTKN